MHRTKTHIGLILVIILCLTPVVLWLLMKPLELRFGSFVMWMTSIGQLSALLGTAMYAVSLILIARFKPLEPYFGGLDRIFLAHKRLGMTGFMLLLVHPLTLAIRYIPVSVSSAATFLLPSMEDIPKTLRIIGFLLMMLLIGITILATLRYQRLLFAHKLLGVGFMFGALHGFLIPSDISNNLLLASYMAVLVLFGTGAYLYRTLFAKLIPKYIYTVHEVRQLSHTVTEIVMHPTTKRLFFTPGQFIFVSFKHGNISEEVHPFSISSSPHEEELRITIKALGDYTTAVPALTVGTKAYIEGPFGGFTNRRAKYTEQIWVAGGIGITPLLSRARFLPFDEHPPRSIDLYYTTNIPEEMLYLDELKFLSVRYPGLRIIPHASKEKGFLSASTLLETSGPLQQKDIFICGPPPMMKNLIQQCKECGVPKSQIHAEEFSML